MLSELFVAFALVLVIEGVLYALFPDAMQRMLEQISTLSPQSLRYAGLFSAILGVAMVWALKS
ncbi:MAG: DUF2065 domain-containing protein [Proteobacteria bacterium]|jgi:uncharacterized protein YjeT (DUF2065 family)|nr:DUF2065 domain-containing protein [Pseudomonadota bacterium]MDA1324182.1 DUF2065 domain-containing protein [Pseudomonadota bacterium]